MTLTWQFVAAVQLPILVLAAMAVWVAPRLTLGLLRLPSRATTASAEDRAGGAIGAETDGAPINARQSDVSSRTSQAPKGEANEMTASAPLTETQIGWQRIRAGLCAQLDETDISVANADELHRLLCTVDRLLNVPSPERTLRDDGGPASWAMLLASLSALSKAHATMSSEAADPLVTTAVAAVIAAAGDMRPAELTPQTSPREQELKQLISQFTKDSRDMLASIRRLELENVELRNSLGETPQPV